MDSHSRVPNLRCRRYRLFEHTEINPIRPERTTLRARLNADLLFPYHLSK